MLAKPAMQISGAHRQDASRDEWNINLAAVRMPGKSDAIVSAELWKQSGVMCHGQNRLTGPYVREGRLDIGVTLLPVVYTHQSQTVFKPRTPVSEQLDMNGFQALFDHSDASPLVTRIVVVAQNPI